VLGEDMVESWRSDCELVIENVNGSGDADRVEVNTVLGENMVESCRSDGELVIENVNGSGDAMWGYSRKL
jgi:hypothetical protein